MAEKNPRRLTAGFVAALSLLGACATENKVGPEATPVTITSADLPSTVPDTSDYAIPLTSTSIGEIPLSTEGQVSISTTTSNELDPNSLLLPFELKYPEENPLEFIDEIETKRIIMDQFLIALSAQRIANSNPNHLTFAELRSQAIEELPELKESILKGDSIMSIFLPANDPSKSETVESTSVLPSEPIEVDLSKGLLFTTIPRESPLIKNYNFFNGDFQFFAFVDDSRRLVLGSTQGMSHPLAVADAIGVFLEVIAATYPNNPNLKPGAFLSTTAQRYGANENFIIDARLFVDELHPLFYQAPLET